ncbi:MAG: type III-B CRISPR module RAMP protein Cmr4 [Kiritimatiellae bacterium]|nr:type III-B CRISPR module RAMP protein Cmr4 [Kiritimatiellia bacterium]
MTTKLLTIFTRTPLHVGCGSSVGAVDLPVIRERHTRFPIIPGSSLKGVLADLWNENAERNEEGKKLFGNTDSNDAAAGRLLIGEGKLLAFPVRSAKGCFAWITCPLALNRFFRDKGMELEAPSLEQEEVFLSKDTEIAFGENVIFEEYKLTKNRDITNNILESFKGLVSDTVWRDMPKKLAIVSDEMFRYFVENTCEIAQHIKIDDGKGVVAKGALFSQENVPSETLFYAVMNERENGMVDVLEKGLQDENNLLQIGADITTGLGWCSVKLV